MADADAWRWLRWPVAAATVVAPLVLMAGVALGTLVILAMLGDAGVDDPERAGWAMGAYVTCLGVAGLCGLPGAAAVLFERHRRRLVTAAFVQAGVGLGLAVVAVVVYFFAVIP